MDIISSNEPSDNLCPETTFIYRLREPDTLEIRYVGKANDPEDRLKGHIWDTSDSYRGHWLTSLRKRGIRPILEIIEECPFADWPDRELYWIRYYFEQGCRLVNTCFGSRGTGYIPLESRKKMSESQKGKKRNPDSVARSAATQRGKKQPPDAIEKTAAAHRGKKDGPLPESTKQKIGTALKGRKKSSKHCANISAGRKGKKFTPFSEQARRNLGDAHRGIRPSQAARDKRSASMKAAWAKKKQPPPEQPTLWD